MLVWQQPYEVVAVMVDITMCNNALCPKCDICYRAQAKPSNYQSWSIFTYGVSPTGVVACENFIPIHQEHNHVNAPGSDPD